jgi:hypothetical protein
MPDYARVSDNLWTHFAPRVGMAWDVSGDGRTSVRSAYGIFYDYPHVYEFNGLRNTPPYDPTVAFTRYLGGLDDPWTALPGGNPYPIPNTQNSKFPAGILYQELDPNFRPPYVHQWNLSIQRQIGREWMATANYIGNSTIHLTNIRDSNPMTAGVRELTRLDPTTPYGALNTYDAGGTGNYNGMWLSLERQSKGMNLRMNYTWSHCIDEGTAPNSVNIGRTGVNRRYTQIGTCDIDRRQMFNLSTVYATPKFANTTLRVLGSGWRISGILKLLSGAPFSVTCGCDRAGSQESAQYAQQLMSNVFTPEKGVKYLNPAAFALPALGTYGNMGRNSIPGPGLFTLDMGLTRQFSVTENQALEFRAEVFNLPNHVNLNPPTSALSSTTFGRVTSAADPRIMQFALKYIF